MTTPRHESQAHRQRDLSVTAKRFIAVVGLVVCMAALIIGWAFSLRETIANGLSGLRNNQARASVFDEMRNTVIELRDSTAALGADTTARIEEVRRSIEEEPVITPAATHERAVFDSLKRTLESQSTSSTEE